MEEKMLNRSLLLIPVAWFFFTGVALAADTNFMEADEFKSILDSKDSVIIADIQKANKFVEHYFFGSIETNAYPVKTATEKQKLNKVIVSYEKTGNIIIIVGPRGTRGAERAYQYLLEKEIPADKIFILKGGVTDWPYQKMFMNIATGCA